MDPAPPASSTPPNAANSANSADGSLTAVSTFHDADRLADDATALVASWLERAEALETPSQKQQMDQLEGVVTDAAGVAFVMQFVDRVIRPDDDAVAADQLAAIVQQRELPSFLGPIDKTLLRAGARLGPLLPSIVMPLARKRMRAIVGNLVVPADPDRLASHLHTMRADGYALNVNLLGEAVLGEREAARRLDELLNLLEQPDIDYVSVKISAIASQLNHWAREDSLHRVTERLEVLIEKASRMNPPTFVNFDMEEYHDLELTMRAFMEVLGRPAYRSVDAGIVLQAYLPDAFEALQELVAWANARNADGGGEIKIRLVKGANLAMEKVDAAIHGWEQAPYGSKVESDANYKRCLDWLLHPERMTGVRLGLGSHNLFDVAWTHLLSEARGVADRVQFEMLQGMAPAQAATVREATSDTSTMLLYTPAVRDADFDVAISYLFRRLEENASDDNFLRHLFDLRPGSPEFAEQERIFRTALGMRNDVRSAPRRQQERTGEPEAAYEIGAAFVNEPDTDPTLADNQTWIAEVVAAEPQPLVATLTTDVGQIDAIYAAARAAQPGWRQRQTSERQRILHRVGDELARRRGELITTMMHEAHKTFEQADVEVAEAIDFARWYGDRATELDGHAGVDFSPFGVIAVVPPWNFPVAIPAGGVLAALAAGNAVVFKPAPETPRCAEVVAEAAWAAGVPTDVLHFVRTPDDDVGRRLIVTADAVILTGAADTAELFLSWKPDMRLFAETSGKNALIVTPNADIDLAVADLARSAFGHSGQKCSAASLAILVGDVYESDRFRRQLIDAVESIELGPSTDITTTMSPIIGPPSDRLERGLTRLDDGERWLVEPRLLDESRHLWSPGVRIGVRPGSWYHRTECFGPVLGLMSADTLDEAIEIQNSSDYGLTGGIHSLDPAEIEQWIEAVAVGNAYVNRVITGAIVQRQPFGGWKRSAYGPGAKAGGPNYVAQLGEWTISGERSTVDDGADGDDYEAAWREHFSVEHDPTGLFCEANIFRYRPLPAVLVRLQADADPVQAARVRRAASVTGVRVITSDAAGETEDALAARLGTLGVARVRVVGSPVGAELRRAANELGLHVAEGEVTPVGRIELQHYLREQAVSRTLHRFGNLIGVG